MFGPHWDDNNYNSFYQYGGYNPSFGNSLGKRGTLNSSRSQQDAFLSDQQKYGIIPRAIEQLFQGLTAKMADTETSYTVYCSFLQIYNEKLYDLFQDKETTKALNIREDKYTGIFVEGQSEYVVTNA
mmetsp:Transcript_17033/g.26318  ORF Transcript_17033/g.26318 Transcript_17033/m.26318 type:complete len:127 (+) Transcript_17033:500-880(+)